MNETERQLVLQLCILVQDLAQALEIPGAAYEAQQIGRALQEGWGNA